jgi:hypothetical protein
MGPDRIEANKDPWEEPTMMAAQSLPNTRTSTQMTTTPSLRLSANSLVGVVTGVPALGPLRAALAFVGIAGDQIEVLDGASGRERLDAHYAGVTGHIRRWFHNLGLGPEADLARQYRQELADGNLLVAVRDVDRSLADVVRDIIVDCDGRCLQHYGRFTVAFLAP